MKNPTWLEFVTQQTARFFHEKGMEPCVSFKNGEVEFMMPEGWEQEELSALMAELEEHLQAAIASIR